MSNASDKKEFHFKNFNEFKQFVTLNEEELKKVEGGATSINPTPFTLSVSAIFESLLKMPGIK